MELKKVIYGDEARQKLFNGLKTVADVVSKTAGPGGRNIAIQEAWGAPSLTKDGIKTAKSIKLSGAEGEGAKILVQASDKTNKLAGDGTTNTCIIAKSIAEEGLKAIAKGVKSTDVKRGIDKAVHDIVEELKKHSKKIETNAEIKQVATISANGDEEIGEFIANAIEKVGEKGVITVEEARGLKTELEIVEGLQFDQGYLSPYFMTNPERQLVEFDNPLVFLYDGKVTNLQSILTLLEQVSQTGRPLVIIADEVENEPLTALVLNHMKGILKCCAVKAPSFGDIRKFIMEDIAILTGGEFISTQLGKKLEDIDASCLGSCKKIKITATETIIIEGNGDKELLKDRIEKLSEEIDNTESSYDKEKLRERIAKLSGGVAVIKVGGATEIEVKEKKDRVDDAACATRAALEEGILPGGGISLIKIVNSLFMGSEIKSDDEKRGVDIVFKAVESQLKVIAENAGKSGEVVVEKVKENKDFNFGYDVREDRYGDLMEFGIVDATKVVRCALENGSSVAGSLLTVEGLVIDDLEENAKIMNMMRPNPQMGM